VLWTHELICGHTTIRKRKSSADVIGCVKCLEAVDFEELSESLTIPVESPMNDRLDEAEAEAMKIKALLAGRFDVPPEQVDVIVRPNLNGIMEPDSATVSFTRRQLLNLK